MGAQVVIGAGEQEEPSRSRGHVDHVSACSPGHVAGEPVHIRGGFASGVVPPSLANGSTGSVLKTMATF